jgi:hypothetical protein
MRSVHAPLAPGDEALELRDVGAADPFPTIDPDAFAGDELTDREIDEMFVAEMGRREQEAGDGPDADPPGGASIPDFAAHVAGLADDVLVAGISMADESAPGTGWAYFMGIQTAEHKNAYLCAASAEVLRRLESRQPLAA